MVGMRILVIGSGAREHAIVRALSGHEVHVTPGNPGMEATRHEALPKEQFDLVVIGPEQPLVEGLADQLRAQGMTVFGPSAAAAQLEGSKKFAKEVMEAAGVKTARAEVWDGTEECFDRFGPTWVVKDDGLAGGKGVVVTADRDAALAHARSIDGDVLLESFLDGPELSLFCLVNGEKVVPLLPAQDHKRAYDGDEGPNTGGMGAYCPLPWLPEGGVERIVRDVVEPVAREMVRRGTPYEGLLYAGLAWGKEGPAVVEFNCRFGDPETQAVLSLLKTPLADVLYGTATGNIPELEWEDGFAVSVVLAAQGYPAAPVKGGAIGGSGFLHAGTAVEQGQLVAAGGRVLNVVGKGATLAAARRDAYAQLEGISLEGSFYRSDIGLKAEQGQISV